MPMSLKKQRMKLLISSLPTLDFKIWVPKWVPKQKNRPSEISKSLLLAISSSTLSFISRRVAKKAPRTFAFLLIQKGKKKWSTGPFFYLAIG